MTQAESGGSGIVSRRLPGQQGGAEQFVMEVPNNKVLCARSWFRFTANFALAL